MGIIVKLDEKTAEKLRKIRDKCGHMSYAETVRFLVNMYFEKGGEKE